MLYELPRLGFFLAKGSTGHCSERDKGSSKFRAYIIFEIFCVLKTSCYTQIKVRVSLACGCCEDGEIILIKSHGVIL